VIKDRMSVNFEMMHARKPNAPAVVLLSGGLDSATVLAIAKKLDYAVYALSFRYGQRHSSELDAATRVAKSLGAVEHQIIDLDLRRFVGGSALTDDAYDVPTSPGVNNEIPITYVPARNTIMLSARLVGLKLWVVWIFSLVLTLLITLAIQTVALIT
jgi:7-cyano-7-deazaguanine synthase